MIFLSRQNLINKTSGKNIFEKSINYLFTRSVFSDTSTLLLFERIEVIEFHQFGYLYENTKEMSLNKVFVLLFFAIL